MLNVKQIQSLIELIQACNRVVLEIYASDFTVENKADDSPLTLADRRCNQIICDYLTQHYPEVLIISEENKNLPYQARQTYQYAWLIDPIDGTKEFIKRNGDFTINIGLVQRDAAGLYQPIFGLVSVPVTKEIYYGDQVNGSYKLSLLEQSITKKPLRVKVPTELLTIVVSESHNNAETEEFIAQRFGQREICKISRGSSLKLLLIAEGLADFYPRLGLTSEWDTCAAHAVVKFAGGQVINYSTGQELTYNKENLLNPYFLCTAELI